MVGEPVLEQQYLVGQSIIFLGKTLPSLIRQKLDTSKTNSLLLHRPKAWALRKIDNDVL